MGIYDRDYYRQQEPGVTLGAPRSMVVMLILVNVAAYFANGLLTGDTNRITDTLAVSTDTLAQPWMWWQFVTCGFAHDPTKFGHILFNMLGLWFLGRAVENRYGRWEFLRLYLVMIVLGSLVWAASNAVLDPGKRAMLLGASGAVSGVVMLFILNNPRATLMLFPIPIPIKAWLFGVILVVVNLFGAVGSIGNIAFGVHLVGMAFAYIYFANNLNLGRLIGGRFSLSALKPKPRLRIHDPADEEGDLGKEVDRILEKIHRDGEGSLTRKERRTLEAASREYQKRR